MWYSINRGWNFDRSLKFALLDRASPRFKAFMHAECLKSLFRRLLGGKASPLIIAML